ncbi:uncharacterized protein N7482_008277 [Penicillium canariense]|uniref:Uncharacterized protein n=1 Tax=Penicillium canariense TaxID=189055 RepID=A0A9W9HVF8_9EURO|nr:uncharacterized protein N7482_008277 [Penicillium canariense]KAJ5157177.1 hypothetical protein N7482_008277 [Penicillium canariense]
MSLPEPHIWCRITLLILTVASFLPQILRIQRKQSTHGVSPLCTLWNLIRATEQFTLFVYALYTAYEPNGTVLLHSPLSQGDRFNLWHCAVVTAPFLALFTQFLLYSDRKISLLTGYISFLLVSIVPLIIDAISPIDDDLARRIFSSMFGEIHVMIIFPILTFLGFCGIYCQAREILAVPFPNSLSQLGLAIQAVVFTLVSVTWIWSLKFPYETWNGEYSWNNFNGWYYTVGWIIFDHFVFALGQAVLLGLALHRSSSCKVSIRGEGGETEPLLGNIVH